MRFWLRALLGAIVVVGIAIAGLLFAYWNQAVPIAAMAINYVRYWSAPPGTLETEVAQTGAAAQPSASTASASPQAAPGGTEEDWPGYNKTLTSNRFSQLSQVITARRASNRRRDLDFIHLGPGYRLVVCAGREPRA
jgi:alcohol dehydrogenase (cytochrome c)